MGALTAAERQLLVAVHELAARDEVADMASARQAGREHFRSALADWSGARADLVGRGLLGERDGVCELTRRGSALAARIVREHPAMFYWYTDYYQAVARSRAHSTFCERVYGKDLCQHGFADLCQLDELRRGLGLTSRDRVLDLGCGNGMIAEYLSGLTGARVHGLDYVPEAIRQARERTSASRDRLTFAVGNIGRLKLAPGSFDAVVAIDTLYFADLSQTVERLARVLQAGGRLGVFYSYSLRFAPGSSADSLEPDGTPLALVLARHGLAYEARDFTAADHRHALLRMRVLADLEAEFAAEGNLFLHENRLAEARGVAEAVAEGSHRRYLYLAARQRG